KAMADVWEHDQGPCLCGKGRVVLCVREDDHPWIANSHRSETTEIRCELCAPKRQVRPLTAEQVKALETIAEEQRSLDRQREQIHESVVGSYFPSANYPSMAAEWRALKKEGLFSESYAVYRRRRSSSIYHAIRWSVSDEWVLSKSTA